MLDLLSAMCAFAMVLGGLLTLALWPLIGTLLIIGGMALTLYSGERVFRLTSKTGTAEKQK